MHVTISAPEGSGPGPAVIDATRERAAAVDPPPSNVRSPPRPARGVAVTDTQTGWCDRDRRPVPAVTDQHRTKGPIRKLPSRGVTRSPTR